MAVEIFKWDAKTGDQGDITFAVLKAQYGDGYTQAVGEGINNESGVWPYTYIGPIDEIEPIRAFLRWHQGYKKFQWTPPFGEPGLYTCEKFSVLPKGGPLVQLTATFQQTFGV